MDIDPSNGNSKSVVSAKPGSMEVILHPAVLVIIADSYSRYRVLSKSSEARIMGVLLGHQSGKKFEVKDAFEMPLEKDGNGKYIFDYEFYAGKKAMIDKVPNLQFNFLGWYTNGPIVVDDTIESQGEWPHSPTPEHLDLHLNIMERVEIDCALFLHINTLSNTSAKNLPLAIYENSQEQQEGKVTNLFSTVKYEIKSDISERIAVDYVAHAASDVNQKSKLASHFKTQQHAVSMLYSRVKVLLDYVNSAIKGEIEATPEILREISAFCNQMPLSNSEKFKSTFEEEYNQVQLIACLAEITKGCEYLRNLKMKSSELKSAYGGGSYRNPYKDNPYDDDAFFLHMK